MRAIVTEALPEGAEPKTLVADVAFSGLVGAAVEYVLKRPVHAQVAVYESDERVEFDERGLTAKWIKGANLDEAIETASGFGMGERFFADRTALFARDSGGGWPKDWLFDRPVLLKTNARGGWLLLLSPEAPNRAAFFVEGR